MPANGKIQWNMAASVEVTVLLAHTVLILLALVSAGLALPPQIRLNLILLHPHLNPVSQAALVLHVFAVRVILGVIITNVVVTIVMSLQFLVSPAFGVLAI